MTSTGFNFDNTVWQSVFNANTFLTICNNKGASFKSTLPSAMTAWNVVTKLSIVSASDNIIVITVLTSGLGTNAKYLLIFSKGIFLSLFTTSFIFMSLFALITSFTALTSLMT